MTDRHIISGANAAPQSDAEKRQSKDTRRIREMDVGKAPCATDFCNSGGADNAEARSRMTKTKAPTNAAWATFCGILPVLLLNQFFDVVIEST